MGKRKGLPVDGWLALDKPAGLSSSRAVLKARFLLNARKAGHGGTLDPLATGILPIAFGEATKTLSYITETDKEYRFTIRWGQTTETDDREGRVTAENSHRPDRAAIEAALPAFIGDIEQTPPAYSAIKIDGKRAYKLARDGEAPDIKSRIVTVKNATLVDCLDEDHAEFHITSGKGFYVRALARDLARALGTEGHIAALRRTRVGPFDESCAISLEKLEQLSHSARAEETLLPLMTALADIPAVAVTAGEADRMRQGQTLRLPTAKAGTVIVINAEKPVAIAFIKDGAARPLRVFNLNGKDG